MSLPIQLSEETSERIRRLVISREEFDALEAPERGFIQRWVYQRIGLTD